MGWTSGYTRNIGSERAASGFTLLEVAGVVTILGILTLIVVRQVDVGPAARAVTLHATARQMVSAWDSVTQTCGADAAASPAVLGASPGVNAADILAVGATLVAAPYQQCYAMSGARPISDGIQVIGGKAVSIQGFSFDFTGGGSQPLVVTYYRVPDDVAGQLALRFAHSPPPGLPLPASNTTDAHIQYASNGDGTFTAKVLFAGGDGTTAAVGAVTGATSTSGSSTSGGSTSGGTTSGGSTSGGTTSGGTTSTSTTSGGTTSTGTTSGGSTSGGTTSTSTTSGGTTSSTSGGTSGGTGIPPGVAAYKMSEIECGTWPLTANGAQAGNSVTLLEPQTIAVGQRFVLNSDITTFLAFGAASFSANNAGGAAYTYSISPTATNFGSNVGGVSTGLSHGSKGYFLQCSMGWFNYSIQADSSGNITDFSGNYAGTGFDIQGKNGKITNISYAAWSGPPGFMTQIQ